MPQENANNQSFTFNKKERICSDLIIKNLIQKKQILYCFPFRCYYSFSATTTDGPNQILISVPKRLFKHAVQRNRLKRLIREAYRLHHREILDSFTAQHQVRAEIFITFIGKELLPYIFIENKIIEVLNRLCMVDNLK